MSQYSGRESLVRLNRSSLTGSLNLDARQLAFQRRDVGSCFVRSCGRHVTLQLCFLFESNSGKHRIASICMSRFMLRLRAVAQEDRASQHRPWATVRFATMAETLVGDIGAELSDGPLGGTDATHTDMRGRAMRGEAVLGSIV